MKTLFIQPLITEKSMAMASNGVYQFVVPTWANKRGISDLVSKQFGVTVERVATATLPSRNVTFRRGAGVQGAYKKASVYLKKGQSIAEFSLPVETPSESSPAPKANEAETVTKSKITVRSKSKKAGA